MKPSNSMPWYRIALAVVCWSNVLLVAPHMLIHSNPEGAVGMAMSLMAIFFYPLRPDDERTIALRFKAVSAGFGVSFIVLYVGTRILPALDGDPCPRVLLEERFGIWSAIIITLAVAQLLIWFWRIWDSSDEVPMRGWRRVVQMCMTGR